MPSIWTLTLRGKAEHMLLPSPFHGMVSHWIAHDENPARFSAHYHQIGPRLVQVTIRILDDSLEDRARGIPEQHLRPSDDPDKDRSRLEGWDVIVEPVLVARVSWADLLEVPYPDCVAWRVQLLTPTAWSKERRPSGPQPMKILHSVKDHWHKLDVYIGHSTCPLPPHAAFPPLMLRPGKERLVASSHASLELAPHAVLGSFDVTTTAGRDARIVQQLFNFANLSGLGIRRTWGMGAVSISMSPPEEALVTYRDRARKPGSHVAT